MALEAIDAEIVYADSATDTLTGTPNHPFWVDAVRDYVPLGELEVGTVLHVQNGGEAILVSKTWRQGDFEVFDFEVLAGPGRGLHNFYVRGSDGDARGVLVHNSSVPSVGGTHREVRELIAGTGPSKVADGLESHRMVSANTLKAVGVDPMDGPPVSLPKSGHMETPSWGSSLTARAFRQSELDSVNATGSLQGAFDMNVPGAKAAGATDDAIRQAQEALDQLE